MKTKERFFGILLGLALMLVLTAGMSAGAYAATPYPVWVGGVQVTSVNMNDVLGTKDTGATVRYTPAVADDPATTGVDESAPARLTLDGANITSTGSENSHNGAAIYADEDLIVYVAADSAVTGPNNKSDDSYGIFTYDKLNVTGPGTLTATGGEAKGVNGFSYGVYAGDVTVSGTLIGTGSEANHDSCGVNAEFGDVTVAEGGELIAMAGEATSGSSYGVHASEAVTVSGTLDAESGTAANGSSYGVYADRAVTVNGTGTLTAASSEALGSYGVNTEYGDVIVEDGGTLNAEGGATPIGSSYGVFAYRDVTVNGILNAESGAAAGDNGDSYGVYAVSGDVTVSGALSGTGSGADRYSCGVSSKGDVIVEEGGELTAMAGAADIDSSGVSASGSVTVLDAARLRATGNTQAISGSVRNFIAGTGWTNAEGTEYRTEIAVSADPRPLTDFKHVRIPTLYDVWVGGVQVTGLNADDVLDDGTVSYTPAEETAPAILTLKGAAITDSYENAAIFAEVDLTVCVETDSAVTSPDSESNSCGILTYGDLNVTGPGTLTATAGAAKYISYGVRAEEGGVTVAEGGTLNAEGGAVTNGPSYGVCAYEDVTVNGTLTATGSAANRYSYGVYARRGAVNVAEDGGLTATAGTVENGNSYGVHAIGPVNVSGTLDAKSGTAANGFSYGVSAAYVTVNGTLTATSSEAFCSYGVYAEFGDVTVTRGGELTATSDAAESDSSGVSAFENVTVAKGGVLTATGGTASDTDGDSCGVSAVSGDVTVNGELTATGSAANRSNGVYAAETVTVSTTARLTAAGDTEAVSGSVKNAIVGTGWTDAAGTTGQAYLAVSTEGRSLNYRKLQFPAWPAPVYGPPDFTLPGSIATIEANAFEGAAMKIVYIPDTCTAIGAGAFKDCSKLNQIRIPEGCEIGEGAFEGCDEVNIYAPVGSPAQSFCADPANANCTFCETAE